MTEEEQTAYEEVVLAIVRRYGTTTANQVSRLTKRKHETAARMLRILTEKGLVYSDKSGRTVYYTLRVDSTPLPRVRPDRPKTEGKVEEKTEGCGRGSVDVFKRGRTPVEIYPEVGFVLHPSIRGADVGREWVRFHTNGQFVVPVKKEGSFISYFPDTDQSIEWETSYLSTQTVYNAKVFLHNGDMFAYSVRMVASKKHQIKNVSVYTHPRYVYYKEHETYGPMEMRQQVDDVLAVFERAGWEFNHSAIEMKGEYHSALNDTDFGSLVGKYIQYPDDPLHFDRSHGVPEAEVYGKDPATVEMMVNLPNIIRAHSSSLFAISNHIDSIIEIQAKLSHTAADLSNTQATILGILAKEIPKNPEPAYRPPNDDRRGYQ